MRILTFLTFILLAVKSNDVFAQCNSTLLKSENFNSYSGGATTQASITTYLSGQGENAGAYAGAVKAITDNAGAATGNNDWKGNSSSTCNSGCSDCSKYTGATTGAAGDKAYIIDGNSVADGTVWCYTATGNYAAGDIFMISADYSSPWCGTSPNNNPQIYFTVGGQEVVGTRATITQFSGSSSSYTIQTCYYTVPSGGLTSPSICINMCQYGVVSGNGAGSVYGYCAANGQGNDLMVDNIVISTISGAGCTQSGCTVSALPIDVTSFTAEKTSFGRSYVRWSTSSEKNSNHFSVEKSTDGINFYEIGNVSAAGNSFDIRNYEFEDRNFNQSCYYRLKIVDKDGSFQYSKIIFLPNEENHVWLINNVPGSEELEIKAVVREPVRWNIRIYSMLGQEYLDQQVSLSAGENSLLKRKNGRKETCICRISDENGAVIFMEKVFW